MVSMCDFILCVCKVMGYVVMLIFLNINIDRILRIMAMTMRRGEFRFHAQLKCALLHAKPLILLPHFFLSMRI